MRDGRSPQLEVMVEGRVARLLFVRAVRKTRIFTFLPNPAISVQLSPLLVLAQTAVISEAPGRNARLRETATGVGYLEGEADLHRSEKNPSGVEGGGTQRLRVRQI